MNFASNNFTELVLKRDDGAVYTIALTGLEGHNISIGREGNRTVLRVELRADMSHVRYQGAVYGKSQLQLAYEKNLPYLPTPKTESCDECGEPMSRHRDNSSLTRNLLYNAYGMRCSRFMFDRLLTSGSQPSTDKT